MTRLLASGFLCMVFILQLANTNTVSNLKVVAVIDYQLLGHHELRPSVGPVLNRNHTTLCAYVCAVSSLCPISFSSLNLPSTTCRFRLCLNIL